ncbi:MAG TPA: DUF547 domain-containing protein [Candidatus Xenobia bacterium]
MFLCVLAGGALAASTSGLTPLTDLGTGSYKGFQGGLYPDGSNQLPKAHLEAGQSAAEEIIPRDTTGRPSNTGAIAVLGIGSTTATLEYEWLEQNVAPKDKELNKFLKFADTGSIGQSASARALGQKGLEQDRFWNLVDTHLKEIGCTAQQVQVAWVEDSDLDVKDGFPQDAKALQAELKGLVQGIHDHCPHCQVCYLSSHIYAGYATRLCQEPYAYETGFAVKWLIEDQIKGDAELNCDPQRGAIRAPWLAWGPYVWADGEKPRRDGLTYVDADFRHEDHMHPNAGAMDKVAKALLRFFKTDTMASAWTVPGGSNASAAARGQIYTFDHHLLDDLLTTYVADGKVDYKTMKESGMPQVNQYLSSLANAEPDKLSTTTERLAFWLNAYNACSIKASLDGFSLDTKGGRHKFFSESRYLIAGHLMSLDDMEHLFMGKLFNQPKTHFGLVCSSNGCPILKNKAYDGSNVQGNLDDNARAFINNPDRVHWNSETKVLAISEIFDWYKEDFTKNGGTVVDFIKKYLPTDQVAEIDAAQTAGTFKQVYMDYDWSLNKQEQPPAPPPAATGTPAAPSTPTTAPTKKP